MTTRRDLLIGSGAALAAPSCQRSPPPGRADVVAAGQTAALLVWAVARHRLAGWPRRPDPKCLAALPALASTLPELGALASGGGRPANLEAIAALKPGLAIDYGDIDATYRALDERMTKRLAVEWRLLDGALSRIPAAIREAADLLEVGRAAEPLAAQAADVLRRWSKAPAGPSFYYARGADGLETGFRGALATEVLEGAGWTNVAEGGRDIGRVEREQVVAWDPEAIVTLNPAFAATAVRETAWKWRRDGTRRRVLLVPDLPFGWIDRPPSVNRLLGCAWVADPKTDQMGLTLLCRRLYGMAPVEVTLPQWIG